MDRDRELTRRSFFRFPKSWGDMEDKLSQWMGREDETGVGISEDNDNVYVEAQLPGLDPEHLDISLHQNTLRIRGEKIEEEQNKERKYYSRAKNSFFYQVELPSQVEEGNEEAHYENGILKLKFKKTQQSQTRRIPIKGL